MNDNQLDRLTRALAGRLDRRAITGLAGVAGVTALLGREPEAEARKKKK
jgi:hypothetical protein